MQKTSKNKSTPKLAIHPHLKKARYSRIFKIKQLRNLVPLKESLTLKISDWLEKENKIQTYYLEKIWYTHFTN